MLRNSIALGWASGSFQTARSRIWLQKFCSVLSRSVALRFVARHAAGPMPLLDPGDLAPEQAEIVARIWCQLPHEMNVTDCEPLLRAALHRLRKDLRSDRSSEVLQEIGREIAFRKWCDEQTRRDASHPN